MIHDGAKWFSTGAATAAAWLLANGQQMAAVVASVLSLLGFVGSWWVAWQVKWGEARRRERWADAALEWQIEELRKGRIQMPRDTRQAPELPPVPDPPAPPIPDPQSHLVTVPVPVLTSDPDIPRT